MITQVDDSICPLCQQSNRCDVQSPQGCWCMASKVPAALLAQLPAQFKATTCICNRCIEQYHQQQLKSDNT